MMAMKAKVFTAILAIFGTGLIGGYVLHDILASRSAGESTRESASKQVRQMGSYTYINPLLECEVAEGTIDAEKQNFRVELEAFVEQLKTKHELTEAAVYFRDLNNGPAFGVNTTGEFFPASLLKVPVMMLYYRWAEQDPRLLSTEIRYEKKKDFGITPTIISQKELVLGESYSVEELIERMILYSDNQALGLLSERLPLERTFDLFRMLGVADDVVTESSGKLRVSEYSSFFRILFNSSYLSAENSEKALALLARTEFDDGIVAGLPEGLPVSHKFGEAGSEDAERQLHDCGIVYFPGHPYLTCIMTRGYDTEKLKQAIRETSQFIHGKIDEQY